MVDPRLPQMVTPADCMSFRPLLSPGGEALVGSFRRYQRAKPPRPTSSCLCHSAAEDAGVPQVSKLEDVFLFRLIRLAWILWCHLSHVLILLLLWFCFDFVFLCCFFCEAGTQVALADLKKVMLPRVTLSTRSS